MRLAGAARLADWDGGIVAAVDHEQPRADRVHVGQRRCSDQEVAVVRERPVFQLAMRAAVHGGVLEERDQVRDADDVDAAGPQLGLTRESGERRVAALRAAVEHHPRRVQTERFELERLRVALDLFEVMLSIRSPFG